MPKEETVIINRADFQKVVLDGLAEAVGATTDQLVKLAQEQFGPDSYEVRLIQDLGLKLQQELA